MRLLPIFILPVALAACSNEKTVTATNASIEDVQNQVAAAGETVTMRPGQWEGTVSIKNTVPGMAAPQTVSQPLKMCVTEEMTKPGSNPFSGQLGAGCKYDEFKMEGGKIDATMTCNHQGMTMKSKMNGEFTPVSYTVNSVAEASGDTAGPMAGMKAETTMEAKRTGDCAAGAPKG